MFSFAKFALSQSNLYCVKVSVAKSAFVGVKCPEWFKIDWMSCCRFLLTFPYVSVSRRGISVVYRNSISSIYHLFSNFHPRGSSIEGLEPYSRGKHKRWTSFGCGFPSLMPVIRWTNVTALGRPLSLVEWRYFHLMTEESSSRDPLPSANPIRAICILIFLWPNTGGFTKGIPPPASSRLWGKIESGIGL